jgi:hypothetical protein
MPIIGLAAWPILERMLQSRARGAVSISTPTAFVGGRVGCSPLALCMHLSSIANVAACAAHVTERYQATFTSSIVSILCRPPLHFESPAMACQLAQSKSHTVVTNVGPRSLFRADTALPG